MLFVVHINIGEFIKWVIPLCNAPNRKKVAKKAKKRLTNAVFGVNITKLSRETRVKNKKVQKT